MANAEYEERYEIKAPIADQWYRDYSCLGKKPILMKFNNMIQCSLSAREMWYQHWFQTTNRHHQ